MGREKGRQFNLKLNFCRLLKRPKDMKALAVRKIAIDFCHRKDRKLRKIVRLEIESHVTKLTYNFYPKDEK